jgi:hypothetical protein
MVILIEPASGGTVKRQINELPNNAIVEEKILHGHLSGAAPP